MVFEWDERKAVRNERRHGVRFGEAVSVFADPNAFEFVDEAHSRESEISYGIIGLIPPGAPIPGWWRNMKNKGKGSSFSSNRTVEAEFTIRRDTIRMIPRRHRATATETAPRNCKVRVTMYLDADIVEHFKARAARPDAAAYQTQINSALRSLLASDPVPSSYQRLVNDDRFISAIAKRLAGRRSAA